MNYSHLNKINFWKRLEMFISNVQVNDLPGQEERDMIYNNAIKMQSYKSDDGLEVAWKALEFVGFTRGEEFTDDDINKLLTN